MRFVSYRTHKRCTSLSTYQNKFLPTTSSFWSNDSIDDIKEDDYGMDSLDRTLHEFENFLNKYI